jgi:hypothetical protein
MTTDLHVVFVIIHLTATSQKLGRVVIKTMGVQMFRGLARELVRVTSKAVRG